MWKKPGFSPSQQRASRTDADFDGAKGNSAPLFGLNPAMLGRHAASGAAFGRRKFPARPGGVKYDR
jgi:hypothetical protein